MASYESQKYIKQKCSAVSELLKNINFILVSLFYLCLISQRNTLCARKSAVRRVLSSVADRHFGQPWVSRRHARAWCSAQTTGSEVIVSDNMQSSPISVRLPATPISVGGGGNIGPPLRSRKLSGRFGKFKMLQIPLPLNSILKKRKFQKF